MNTLITGVAGFIGFHTAERLLKQGERIIGVDNLNHYYDVNLKNARLAILENYPNFSFIKADIAHREVLTEIFKNNNFKNVIHLAAQAGVRYSLEAPQVYVESNLLGFGNILECARHFKINHLLYASTSSVYGANAKQPYSEHVGVDHPISLYASTKRANELMAHSYACLYNIPCTGLRFFTVYGPWGRPDMAFFKFTQHILENRPIDIYNHGNMLRDFTYVDDIVTAILNIMARPAQPNEYWQKEAPDPATSFAPYRIYNIGNNNPVKLMDFVNAIEDAVGRTAIKNYLPMQPGDVYSTYADVTDLVRDFNFKPMTSIQNGIRNFVRWYREYYQK